MKKPIYLILNQHSLSNEYYWEQKLMDSPFAKIGVEPVFYLFYILVMKAGQVLTIKSISLIPNPRPTPFGPYGDSSSGSVLVAFSVEVL
jgi:hypothetical protein